MEKLGYLVVGVNCTLLVILIPALYSAARIVTFYQIMEGTMRNMAVAYTLLGGALMTIGAMGLVFNKAQGHLVPLSSGWELFVTLALVMILALGVLIIPLGVLGLLAEYYDDPKRSALFSRIARTFVLPVLLLASVTMAGASGSFDSFVSDNCRQLLQFGSDTWYAGDNFKCTKYYGEVSGPNNTVASIGRSSHLQCNSEDDVVYAWEYNNPARCSGHMYGCLNFECCESIRLLMRRMCLLLTLLGIFAAATLFLGARGAEYVNDHFLMQQGSSGLLQAVGGVQRLNKRKLVGNVACGPVKKGARKQTLAAAKERRADIMARRQVVIHLLTPNYLLLY